MTHGNPVLIDLIRSEIRARGPISFAWFMQQALYHPQHGYYSSGRAAIGRKGDYFTNVSVGPLFGRLLCAQFVEMWARLGETEDFTIVEQGAHNGQFACDALQVAQESWPKFFGALHYRIIEPFRFWQDRQRRTLESFQDKVEWSESIRPFVGVHFSNELLDAMPINLRGKLVGLEGDKFILVEGPDADSRPKPNQAGLDWIDNVAGNLIHGYVLIIDYGFLRDEFREMIQARAQHRRLDSPFEQIGCADITAHVHWSSIIERAEQNGLRTAGFTDQHHFLTGIISEWPDLLQTGSLDSTALSRQVSGTGAKTRRALQTLLHPEMLGRSFQVLALEKNVNAPLAKTFGAGARLAGLKFARTHDL